MYEEGVFNLAFGSSLVWTITGGTNFWKDLDEKYLVSQTQILLNENEGSLDPDAFRFEKIQESTTLFKYSL